ncbi:hypothetical protein [Mucilaginibacter sp. L3T2-6]|uniref:hypothetical protein n=1 Tax=Mucilaginibacter sp. L3T2-6 TaxID=3062491 RepID=UPI00267474B5|nr:hypothetical protein [Mucilaginibacter sp. L3T2-6]MDO3645260.1 hypothetical protein [Mucilaginibacter sp. L3T2-6]MDV6217712.1 hypothetical protein [Mucilaginibacter sp. L3T2-6]
MHQELTPGLIAMLLQCGYTHFLSRTILLPDECTGVVLTPVRQVPLSARATVAYVIGAFEQAITLPDAIILVELSTIKLTEQCRLLTSALIQ